MTLHFLEPHPSLPSGKNAHRARLGTGRGGAGNYTSYAKASLTEGPTATGPASRHTDLTRSQAAAATASAQRKQQAAHAQSQSGYVFAGIGGAGNARPADERRIFSFDEELERDRKMMGSAAQCPVYHIGRGGSGNLVVDRPSRQGSAASISSSESDGRGGLDIKKSLDTVRGRLVRALSRE